MKIWFVLKCMLEFWESRTKTNAKSWRLEPLLSDVRRIQRTKAIYPIVNSMSINTHTTYTKCRFDECMPRGCPCVQTYVFIFVSLNSVGLDEIFQQIDFPLLISWQSWIRLSLQIIRRILRTSHLGRISSRYVFLNLFDRYKDEVSPVFLRREFSSNIDANTSGLRYSCKGTMMRSKLYRLGSVQSKSRVWCISRCQSRCPLG